MELHEWPWCLELQRRVGDSAWESDGHTTNQIVNKYLHPYVSVYPVLRRTQAALHDVLFERTDV